MSKISIYQKVTDTYSKETLLIDQFIHNLQNSEQYQSHVIDVRSGRKDKRECPNVTISGTFDKRFDKDLKEHSGFICIDIDKEDPELVKLSLSGNEYVYCVFTSISGNGAAVIFKINPAVLMGGVAGARSHSGPAREAAKEIDSSVPWIGFPVGYAVSGVLLTVFGYFAMVLS